MVVVINIIIIIIIIITTTTTTIIIIIDNIHLLQYKCTAPELWNSANFADNCYTDINDLPPNCHRTDQSSLLTMLVYYILFQN